MNNKKVINAWIFIDAELVTYSLLNTLLEEWHLHVCINMNQLKGFSGFEGLGFESFVRILISV